MQAWYDAKYFTDVGMPIRCTLDPPGYFLPLGYYMESSFKSGRLVFDHPQMAGTYSSPQREQQPSRNAFADAISPEHLIPDHANPDHQRLENARLPLNDLSTAQSENGIATKPGQK